MLGFALAIAIVITISFIIAFVAQSRQEPVCESPLTIDEQWFDSYTENTCCSHCGCRPPVEILSNIEDEPNSVLEEHAILAVRQNILSYFERDFPPPTEQSDEPTTIVEEKSEVSVEVPVERDCKPVLAEISDIEPFPNYDPKDNSFVSESNTDTGWSGTDTSTDDYSYSSDDGGVDCGSSDCGSCDDGVW